MGRSRALRPVRSGRDGARSLPSYNHSRRYWRRLFHLTQGESAEATAFWQALPARMAPQTHRACPVLDTGTRPGQLWPGEVR